MQQTAYFGSLEALSDPRNVDKFRRTPQNSPKDFLRRKKRDSYSNIKLFKVDGADTIKVNVSGKYFNISARNLARFPNSLLSNEEKRKVFYNPKKNEYFLDHNRLIACSIEFFYEYGFFQIPENIPEYLVLEELNFYGLYEYLDVDLKAHFGEVHNVPKSPDLKSIREKLYVMLESPNGVGVNLCARCYNAISLSLILISIFLLCYATVIKNDQQRSYASYFDNASQNWVFLTEIVCIGFFTVELFLRFVVSHEKRRFFFSFLNIIDFVAIAPFYIGLVLDVQHITTPLTILRVLRIGKIFRVLKISRYNTSLLIIAKTLKSGRWDLWMLCFLLLILCLFYGSFVYYIEQIINAEESEFESIPYAIWWALTTALSVGYGDVVPKTPVGQIIAALCAVSGVVVVAPILPIIFNRWSRFNRLQQEAKLHKKCKRFKREIKQDVEHLNLIRVHGDRKKGKFFF